MSKLSFPRKLMQRFLKHLESRAGQSIPIDSIRGHVVPAGGFDRNIAKGRVILVGDAAGFVNPVTGEGMYYAIKSGQLAAKAAIDHIQASDSDIIVANSYVQACDDIFGEDLQIALKVSLHFSK